MTKKKKQPEWSDAEAIDLLSQGYSVHAAAAMSGRTVRWLNKQRVPRQTRLQKMEAQVARR